MITTVAHHLSMSAGKEKENAMKHPVAPSEHPGDFRPAKAERMKLLHRIGTLAALMALMFLISPGVAGAQNYRNCAWPVEISPEGIGNWLGPESLARYWLMPVEKQDEALTFKGTYPNARYFSFVAYNTNAEGGPTDVAGGVYDTAIAPDPGSNNPFVYPGGSDGTYTVVISRTGETSGNTIKVTSDFAWVLLRVYVPTADPSLGGESLTGSVPLPTIFLTRDGATQELQQCPTFNKLADIREVYQKFFPPGLDLIGDEGTPYSDRLWFGAPRVTPPILLPNPHNKYIAMFPGNDYQPGRIIVIHGKAPGFPDTYDGTPIWAPARGFRNVDTRFWSVCNTDLALPVGTVGCKSDMTTKLEGGYYTIVISDDPLRPDWLQPNIDWLPWGDKGYFKLVFFRNMLPRPDFHFAIQNALEAKCTFEFDLPVLPPRIDVDRAGQCAQDVMGDYYPVAVWCDKATFIKGGWQACIKEKHH
ncbi:MAG: hypothetical protein AB9919_11145 [Geobacteraceae bacterium]